MRKEKKSHKLHFFNTVHQLIVLVMIDPLFRKSNTFCKSDQYFIQHSMKFNDTSDKCNPSLMPALTFWLGELKVCSSQLMNFKKSSFICLMTITSKIQNIQMKEFPVFKHPKSFCSDTKKRKSHSKLCWFERGQRSHSAKPALSCSFSVMWLKPAPFNSTPTCWIKQTHLFRIFQNWAADQNIKKYHQSLRHLGR